MAIACALALSASAEAQRLPSIGAGIYGAVDRGLAATAEVGFAERRFWYGARFLWSEDRSGSLSAAGIVVAATTEDLAGRLGLELGLLAVWRHEAAVTEVRPAGTAGITLRFLKSPHVDVAGAMLGYLDSTSFIPLLGVQGRFMLAGRDRQPLIGEQLRGR